MANVFEENTLIEYFKIEYNNQNINDNPSYLKWKESNIELKGKDTRFLKCKDDNIIFACTKKSLRECPIYQSTCPICKKNICYYCSIYHEDSYVNGECCIKRRISCMFFQDGFRFINHQREERGYYIKYSEAFKIFIIPFYSLLVFIYVIHYSFFYKLRLKKRKGSYPRDYEGFMGNHHDDMLIIFIVINVAFAIMIAVPFVLLHSYLIIFLLVISLPFKNYPLKYFIGIAYANEF